jgi:putative ABC transport system substrate-binding protein
MPMRKLWVSTFLSLGLGLLWAALAGGPAQAQPSPRIPRVGVLWAGPAEAAKPYMTAGLETMRELGWTEGRNFVIEHRWGEGKADRVPGLAADLARVKVDVIVAIGDPAVEAARQATSTIPIVMFAVGDAVGQGFVSSMARPGGNITGLGALSVELSGKRLELLKQIVPRISRVAVLWNPGNPAGLLGFKETETSARQLGVVLLSRPVRARQEVDLAFSAMVQDRADGLVVVTDPLTWTQRREIIALAAKHRLPAVYELREYVNLGGLVSYGPSLVDMARRAAVFVDKILKGANPSTLPVEQPTSLELVISAKVATELGFAIPQPILVRANHVIR